jgi:hypothetical protein
MPTWRLVNLDIPEAEVLADMAGIQDDLEAVQSICDLLLQGIKLTGNASEFILPDALLSAALVRYARIFSKGGVRAKEVPISLKASIPPTLLEKHKWFIECRNKHIARSINAFETNQVMARLVPEEIGPKGISDISVQRQRLLSLGSEKIADLKTLCGHLLTFLEALIAKEKSKVIKVAKKIPVEQLYSQKLSPRPFPKDGDVTKPRKAK